MNTNTEKLDQYDHVCNEYLDTARARNPYVRAIGAFVLDFSYMEHELNIAIAEVMQHGSHHTGYVVIQELRTSAKIKLFYNLYCEVALVMGKKGQVKKLKEIKSRMSDVNRFRNILLHANWQTLDKDGWVRSRIEIFDKDFENHVSFKKYKMLSKTIKEKSVLASLVCEEISEYVESAWTE